MKPQRTLILSIGFFFVAHSLAAQQARPPAVELRSPEATADEIKGLKGRVIVDRYGIILSVHLDRTKVTDTALEHWKGGLTELSFLWLSDTKVGDAGLEHLKGLTKLKWLLLSQTKVTNAGLEHLSGLTELEGLIA